MQTKKILILGSTGMLGHAVSGYLSLNSNFEIVHTYRTSVHKETLSQLCQTLIFNDNKRNQNTMITFDINTRNKWLLDSLPSDVDYVINCIGCVKQKDYDLRTYLSVNSQFPIMLSQWCEKNSSKLIHITTDCVYSGTNLNEDYSEIDMPDCEDIYGISKEIGEPDNCLVLRTSIIGKEIRANYSLLEWARSQKNKKVDGYVNHIWNGITNVQYAKICEQIIENNMWEKNLYHVFSTPVSKYEMLVSFNEKFNLNLGINPCVHNQSINRKLSTIYDFNSKLNIPSFNDMILEI